MISFSLDKHSEVGLLDHMVVPFLILRGTSTDEWIKKMWHIYTMEYYSAKERNGVICSEVDGPRVCHTQ